VSVGDAAGQHYGVLPADDLEQRDQLVGLDERAGAVVDEDVGDVGRQRLEGKLHRAAPLAAAPDQQGGGGGAGGKGEHLALIAVDDHVEVRDPAGEEGGGRMGEHRPASEGGEDLVGYGPGHPGTAAGGEKDGGGAAHRC